MAESSQSPEQVALYRMGFLYMGVGASIFLAMILDYFHTTTELVATDEKTFQVGVKVAGIAALLAAALGVYLTRKLKISQRVGLPVLLLIEVAIVSAIITMSAAKIIAGWVDFPAGKTHIRQIPLKIARGVHKMTKGGGQSPGKYIVLAPEWTWPDLEITDEDYRFMVKNSPSGETGYYEVASDGLFCARLSMEQSDKSLRILHSTSKELPRGTVILCPASAIQPNIPR